MGANEDLLIQYCQSGSANEVLNLIETSGENLDINVNRAEPLRITVAALDYATTQVLLEAKADPNIASSAGENDSGFCLADQLNDPSMNILIGPY